MLGPRDILRRRPDVANADIDTILGLARRIAAHRAGGGMVVDTHSAIEPGYHMNKKHWNTLILDHSLKPKLVKELIDHSWQLVVDGMTKSAREALEKSK